MQHLLHLLLKGLFDFSLLMHNLKEMYHLVCVPRVLFESNNREEGYLPSTTVSSATILTLRTIVGTK